VTGVAGRYGSGHAWVSLRIDDQIFVVEPLLRNWKTFPRLETLRYKPAVSVQVSGTQVKFFDHAKHPPEAPLRVVAPLMAEWLIFQFSMWSRLLLLPIYLVKRIFRRRKRVNTVAK